MEKIIESPVRNIGMGYSSLRGKIVSKKTNRQHKFESSLERDFLEIIDFDNNVLNYCEQPVTIEYKLSGVTHYYTPDFIVYCNSKNVKPLLCEIKYRKDLKKNWQELKPKFKAAIEYASNKNWRFKIITEKEIHNQYLVNIKFLSNYKEEKIDKLGFLTGIDENDFNLLRFHINEIKITTPEELMLMCSSNREKQAELLYTIWYLVTNNWVKCDLSKPLTIKSEIWVD
jgi:hypothetical protein